MKIIEFLLPLKTVAGLNSREHWRVRAKRVKRERDTARIVAQLKLSGRSVPCVVTLTRLSAGVLDSDNLQGSQKGIRDGVADALGVDDADPAVTWQYRQQKCKRGEFGVVVNIFVQAIEDGQ